MQTHGVAFSDCLEPAETELTCIGRVPAAAACCNCAAACCNCAAACCNCGCLLQLRLPAATAAACCNCGCLLQLCGCLLQLRLPAATAAAYRPCVELKTLGIGLVQFFSVCMSRPVARAIFVSATRAPTCALINRKSELTSSASASMSSVVVALPTLNNSTSVS